ncbi:radical SAM protein [Bradyrhizobium sp. CB1717]|uniref:B12-binding domain-containing radical SAM protein n=1 Tax=Bradyrhizobium sp. CB1717 TaxID=3039154 RepID=UPI0024B20DC9|nr:radical SAM protein [Bradyrhizobium sp. CB1717]WFU25163.1 radical SAM protein [Bradyrhizobium sp. CB1717]
MGFSVGLIHPFLTEAQNKNRLKFRESLALGYLSAALHHARIKYRSINAELQFLDPNEVADLLAIDDDVGLVGLSCKSQRTYRAAKDIARLLKRSRPDMHITIGGVLATAADIKLLEDCPDIDSVVRGEGENAIVELATRVRDQIPLDDMLGVTFRRDGGIVRNDPRARIGNLDDLNFPLRDDLRYVMKTTGAAEASAYIVASRGCYAACTFCSIHQIYGNRAVVRRTPGNVVSEIEKIINDYGIQRFSFVDDIFLIPSRKGVRWVEEFCDLIWDKRLDINFYAEMRADTLNQNLLSKMKRSGMHRIFIGFEAGVDSVLQRWDKGTTVADNNNAIEELKKSSFEPFQINMGYIMFDPEMTLAELKQQFAWVKGTGYAKVQHLQNKMNIYWGTPHYDRMVAQGRVSIAPFGERWEYEFDDPGVRFVEKCVRLHHRRFEDDESRELLDAKERFRVFVRGHEDIDSSKSPRWLTDLVSQAHRRLEWLEREIYFTVFETAFRHLDSGGDHSAVQRENFFRKLWTALLPAIQRLREEAICLNKLIAGIPDMIIGTATADKLNPGPNQVLFNSTRQIAALRLSTPDGGDLIYTASIGFRGEDRYDHSCKIDRIIDGSRRGWSDIDRSSLRQWTSAVIEARLVQ